MTSLRSHRGLLAVLAVCVATPAFAQKVLFEAGHGQMAGNADWVLDEDTCGSPSRFPTPSQTGITSTTGESYWSGAFSAFGVDLVKKGFSLETLPPGARITYGDSTNAQDLSNYKVFIIPEPNVVFTAAEKSAIIAFVRGGGGLFMISDHSGSDRNNDGWDSPMIFNDLMSTVSWGIHFGVSTDTNNWFDDHPDNNVTTDATSVIVHGKYGNVTKGLGLFGSTSMTLSPASNPNVKGHIWMTTGTVGSNTQVTFATSADGTGRIAAITDSSPAEDVTNSCGHTTNAGWTVTTYDNALVHLNAVAWLAGAGGGTPDTTPPSAPTNLTATAASTSQINLSWTASTDNVGVTGYNISGSSDGVTFTAIGTSTTTSYSETGLAMGATRYYRVTAQDAAGNVSAASNTASATTTTASLTVTAPNGGESWAGGSIQNITWTSSNVSNVKLESSLDNGTSWSVIASSVAASTGSYAWTVPSTSSTLARVRASDAQNGAPSDTSDNVFSITGGSPAKVIINEILANEPGSDTNGEFVEILNVGGTSISIAGWTLSDSLSVRHTFASGTSLAPGKAIVVFGGASAIPAGLTNAVAASTGSLALGNSGDTVTLKNGTTTVDSFAYPSSLSGTDGVSMNRNPDMSATGSFVLHTSISSLSSSPGTRADGTAF